MRPALIGLCAIAFCLALGPREAPAKPAKSEALVDQVRKAIEKGIKYLRGQQLPDGSWEVDKVSSLRAGGWTSLSMLALLNAGVPPQDKMLQKGLAWLRDQDPAHTYVRALQTMVYVEAGQGVDKQRIQKNVDWLIKNRVIVEGQLLGWTYTSAKSLPDNSNTQYALLGLHAGHLAGANIPKSIWKEIQDFYLRTQHANGGYGYNRGSAEISYLTMDTAGLCGMIISGLELNKSREFNNKDGTFASCGEYEKNGKMQKTLRLIAERFTVKLSARVYYNLYGLERVGRLSGLRFIGSHDWYREGCKFLVSEQAEGGEWASRGEVFDMWPVINTSFALLFLSKGRTPVLISKMVHGDLGGRYGGRADWNNDRNDAKHLTEFASKVLFKKQALAWQIFDGYRGYEGREETTEPDKLSGLTSELLQSPIVYFNGHNAPKFKDVEIELLKKYAENGGFILAEACCGREGFRTGFTEKTVRELFPDNDLEPLEENHPIWSAFFKVPANKPFKLMGIKRGCKTVLIYSPQDLSCYWESNKVNDADPNYLLAFRLGANIVAYATGLELPDVRLKEKPVLADQKEAPRNAVRPAQLRYGPDWQPAPKAMSNLMDFMEEDAGLQVDRKTEPIVPGSKDIVQFKFLYMHGSKQFSFETDQLKHLRFNLKTGGTLLADACCGSTAFDQSFRVFMKQLLPDNPLVPIPSDKEFLYSADLNGEQIDEGNIRCRVKRSEGKEGKGGETDYRNMAPALEGIKVGNRWVVIYSKYDIGCALEKHQSTDCLGYDHKSALRLGRAVVLYALKR